MDIGTIEFAEALVKEYENEMEIATRRLKEWQESVDYRAPLLAKAREDLARLRAENIEVGSTWMGKKVARPAVVSAIQGEWIHYFWVAHGGEFYAGDTHRDSFLGGYEPCSREAAWSGFEPALRTHLRIAELLK